MRMKSYVVTVEVSGTVTVLVSAPDYDEAEEEAIYLAEEMDLRGENLTYQVIHSEEDGDDE